MQKRIAISIGDVNGIGPEIVIKGLIRSSTKDVTPIVLSSKGVWEYWLDNLSVSPDYHYAQTVDDLEDTKINLLDSYAKQKISVTPGGFTKQTGKCAMLAVEKGLILCKSEVVDALVTAPISKEAVNLAGYNIPGHTEFLAEHTQTSDYMMILVHNSLRVGLATIHIPIQRVSPSLTITTLLRHILIMHRSLKQDFSIDSPRIAVLGLNPHAGDGGIIGTEEQEIISPAISQAKSKGIDVSGPHPADGFFGNKKYEDWDGILAMYHDQGLIPFKTLSFGGGVNFTAGLPIVRTSPDHGTAFDIAGLNKANPSSFIEAFKLAAQLVDNRKTKQL